MESLTDNKGNSYNAEVPYNCYISLPEFETENGDKEILPPYSVSCDSIRGSIGLDSEAYV